MTICTRDHLLGTMHPDRASIKGISRWLTRFNFRPRSWQLLLLVILILTSLCTAQQCTGNVTFVKTSGARLDAQQALTQVLKSQAGQVVLPDCIQLCKTNPDCHVFNMDYALFMCTSIAAPEARQEVLSIIPTTSVFEKICLDDVTNYETSCKNRMWAFERVVALSMVGYRDRTETNVLNRATCGQLCMMENSFACRSAQYDTATRSCVLSREDRRTQPTAFVPTNNRNLDYLENQCALSPITSCTYDTRRDVTATSIEDVRQSSNENECQSNCDRSEFFTCRSYTYVPSQRSCYLSSDDSVSLPENAANRTDRIESIYGERQCTANQCTDGVITFVKVTGYELRSAINQPYMNGGAIGNTAECLTRCREDGIQCPSMSINYATDVCSRLDRSSQYRDRDLVPVPIGGINYFEKVCLRGDTHMCNNKLWAFERVPNHELRGFDDFVIPNVLSLRDCMEACVLVTDFRCRSAEYDYVRVHCTLSTETRRSQPTYFVSTPENVDYLENRCLDDTGTRCDYVEVASAVPRYVDSIMENVPSVDACQHACDSQQTFECYGLGYRAPTQQCILSGDDRASGGSSALVPSSGIDYYEKVCSRSSQINNDTTDDASSAATPPTPGFESTTSSTEPPPTMTPSPETSPPPPVTSETPMPTMTAPIPGSSSIGSSDSGTNVSPVTVPFTPSAGQPSGTDVSSTDSPMPGPPVSMSGRCRDNQGRIEFEKTTGYRMAANDLQLLHDGGNVVLGITYECTIKCNADDTCQGFVLDYVHNDCHSATNRRQSDVEFLDRAQSMSYYEPVCYRSATGCGKLWTFERFPGNQLNVAAASTIRGVTKAECQERCLMERIFLCRSANYDQINMLCHLNADDRYTARSNSLTGSTSYDYLENQCHQMTYISPSFASDNSPRTWPKYPGAPDPRTSKGGGGRRRMIPTGGACYFVNDVPGSMLTYVERETMVYNEMDCQRSCDAETLFNCHSYTYFILARSGFGRGHCLLSADTRNSFGAELRSQPGASYVERICSETAPQSWQPYPQPQPYPSYHPYGSNYPTYSGMPPPPQLPPPPPQYRPYLPPYPAPNTQPYYELPYSVNLDSEAAAAAAQSYYFNSKESLNYLTGDGGQVFPLPGQTSGASAAIGSSRCFSNADVTFERVTHLASQGTGSEVRISLLLSPTLDCIRECLSFGDKCQSVTFRTNFNGYVAPCTIHEVQAGGGPSSQPPVMSPDAAYFQKICIPGPKCGKAWTIDRVPYHVLEGHDDLELRSINSRDECATACVQQTTFSCRSAEYYFSQSICRLSRETRRTQPLAFRFYGDGVEYLENTCSPEPGSCEFTDFSDKFQPYFDRRLLGVTSLYECKVCCGRETGFTCHSVAYDEQSRECYLSSCDRFCDYGIVDRPHTVYSERGACQDPAATMTTSTLFRLQSPNHRSYASCDRSQRIGFERTTGYAPFSGYEDVMRTTSRVRGITQECVTECSSMGDGCRAFVLLHLPPPSPPRCVVYTQSVTDVGSTSGRSDADAERSRNKPEVAYFEKMCLPDHACNKLWAFERIFGYEMVATGFNTVVDAVRSRHDCENLCLTNTNFLCRSAVYSQRARTCRMHVESRHTSPVAFRFVGGGDVVQYLENQCVI